MQHQDFKPVVFKKKTIKKPPPTKQKNTVDNTEIDTIPKVSLQISKNMQKARLRLKISQKDLAHKINVPSKLIQQYENGKAIPQPHILQKIRKVLGKL